MNGRGFARAFGVAMAIAAPVLVSAPGAEAAVTTTIYLNPAGLPGYQAQLDQSIANWNAAVPNVKLVKRSTGTITFRQVSGGGSYTNTNGHGRGTIVIDTVQAGQYSPTRIIAHEIGHNLGLPDHYTGPCSELMSGHGPGTSCLNAKPDARESAQVKQNFINGLTAAAQEFKTVS
ncbi:snapalysin family zinc-dependent metalloprotease [Amycolatopsis sp. cg5]|uniref:snapalysin family zinc-dependent metalloprotease n=1 Tax=Amycolatopsis sp. cg5 TaxID=3238802 RepID=UPI0035248EAC